MQDIFVVCRDGRLHGHPTFRCNIDEPTDYLPIESINDKHLALHNSKDELSVVAELDVRKALGSVDLFLDLFDRQNTD